MSTTEVLSDDDESESNSGRKGYLSRMVERTKKQQHSQMEEDDMNDAGTTSSAVGQYMSTTITSSNISSSRFHMSVEKLPASNIGRATSYKRIRQYEYGSIIICSCCCCET